MSVVDRIQPTPQGPPSIGTVVQQLRPEIQRALPRHMDGDRIARLALTAVRKTPKLAECTPESFAGALLTSAAMGLEPNVHGESYLVPYKDKKRNRTECQLIVGYAGLVKLFWQSPLAKHLDAQAVYAADEFDYVYGLAPRLTHKPAQGDRGTVVAYYAVATLTTGATAFVVLTPDQIKKLRGGKEGASGNIPDPMHWMEKKTALRQLFKTLPRSADLNRALEADEKDGTELHHTLVVEREVEQATTPELDAASNTQWDGPIDGELVDDK